MSTWSGLSNDAAVRSKVASSKAHFGEASCQSVPELAHETLESALDNGRHPQAPKYMYSPMAAFAVPRDGGAIRPFAIQCGQDPAGREIYTPVDGYSWKLAKNCVLVAHNTYHGEVTHL